jgi:hypothetical protein
VKGNNWREDTETEADETYLDSGPDFPNRQNSTNWMNS